jgi:hypothetical protein
MANIFQRGVQCTGQTFTTLTVAFQQMEGHTLRRFWPDAGQAA